MVKIAFLTFGVLVLLVVFAAVLSRGKRGGRAALPYALRPSLLTEAELSFFRVLLQVPGVDQYHVFCMVRLADVLTLAGDVDNRQGAWSRINQKHLDFVLCEPERLAPVLAIELDDSTHGQRRRQERDAFLDEALAGAGLPLWRVKCRRSYAVHELAVGFKGAIQGKAVAAA